MFLVFIAFQNEVDARKLLSYLYPYLGKPVSKSMHTYDDNCELEWQNIWDNFDHYYLCHLGFWFIASFMIRNRIVLHSFALLDEVIGISRNFFFQHLFLCTYDYDFIDQQISQYINF